MALNNSQIDQFNQQGFLVVKDVLNETEDINPILKEYDGVLDNLANKLLAKNKISSLYEDLSFGERYIEIMKESCDVHVHHFDFTLPPNDVSPETPIWLGKAIFNTIRNQKILDVVESLIGSEIFASPVQHVRIKPPESVTPRFEESGNLQMASTPPGPSMI